MACAKETVISDFVEEGGAFVNDINFLAQLRNLRLRLKYPFFSDIADSSDYLHYILGDTCYEARKKKIREYMSNHPDYHEGLVLVYFIDDSTTKFFSRF